MDHEASSAPARRHRRGDAAGQYDVGGGQWGAAGTPWARTESWGVRFPRVRRRLLAALVVVAGALSVGLPAPAQSAPATPQIYVALGDSYAAGPIIPVPIKPWGCLKSSNNYAHMLASKYSLTLRDATCSGAETDDMTNP